MSPGALRDALVDAKGAARLRNEPTELNVIVGSSPKAMGLLHHVIGQLAQQTSWKIASLTPAHTRDIQIFCVRPSLPMQPPAKLKISKLSRGDPTPFAVCIILWIFLSH